MESLFPLTDYPFKTAKRDGRIGTELFYGALTKCNMVTREQQMYCCASMTLACTWTVSVESLFPLIDFPIEPHCERVGAKHRIAMCEKQT